MVTVKLLSRRMGMGGRGGGTHVRTQRANMKSIPFNLRSRKQSTPNMGAPVLSFNTPHLSQAYESMLTNPPLQMASPTQYYELRQRAFESKVKNTHTMSRSHETYNRL